jgi:hypothetical protein
VDGSCLIFSVDLAAEMLGPRRAAARQAEEEETRRPLEGGLEEETTTRDAALGGLVNGEWPGHVRGAIITGSPLFCAIVLL